MLKKSTGFWYNKRVLVTGHTGFKGSWLSLWLQSKGAVLRGVSLEPSTDPALFNVARVGEAMEHVILDVRNYAQVIEQVVQFRPEIVIHMAAQPIVRTSYLDPIETYSTNVMGTVHILEACRAASSVKAVLNVTTDKCYENKEWIWGYREGDVLGGYDPYSSSKACSELVTSAYQRSFFEESGVAVATARAGNVIGGGDWSPDRLIPDVLRALETNQFVEIRNPNSTRPWQHVLEPIAGYLSLAQLLYEAGQDFSGPWNFGPMDEDVKPVNWIVQQLAIKWGTANRWKASVADQPHEANSLNLDITKAQKRLDWKPVWRLDKALDETVCWHKDWLSGIDMKTVCQQQIMKYESEIINTR